MCDEHARISTATERLVEWLESQQYRGYDPYDALKSPLLGALGRRNRYLGIAFTQLLRRLPINLRPLLGIARDYNPKAMGLFLASFVRRYAALRQPRDLERAHLFAQWLEEHQTTGYSGASWGYNFDWANRETYIPQGTPTIVNTALNAQALCDYAHVCNAPWAFDLARGACRFIVRELARCETADGICFSYTPRDTRFVHNANMLGAALLARVGAESGESEWTACANRAVRFTVAAQQADGSWRYGIGAHDNWVDNFHTGYVLGALADVSDQLGCAEWEAALEQGYVYWRTNLIRSDGAPRYYPHSLYPIDAHCVAEAALLFLRMRSRDGDAASAAARELGWGIDHLQQAAGCYSYRITPLYINRIRYLRWSNAWILRAHAEWLWGDALWCKAS